MFFRFPPVRMLALTFVLATALSNCAGPRGGDGDVGCAAERTNFTATADRLANLPAPASGAGEGPLQQLIADLGNAIDRTESSFEAVRTCRVGRAEAMRTAGAPARLASERSAFETDLAAVRQVQSEIQRRQTALNAQIAQLLASAPGSRAKVAKALATVPPIPDPYVATDPTIIQARPDAASERICDLRKGTRVQSTDDAGVPGWTALKLNDGSTGYVQTAYLRPVPLSPSAQQAAARAKAARDPGNDTLVALALAAQDGLTRRIGVFTSMIGAAAESESSDFRVDAVKPSAPVAPVPASS